MTRALAVLLAVLIGTCTPAHAEPCRRAVHVEAGAVAPCAGDLTPTAELLRLLLVEDTLALRDTELAAERELRTIDADEAAALLAVSEAARRACETQHAPPPPRPRHWYESPGFLVPVGIVLGVGLSVVTVYALGAGE